MSGMCLFATRCSRRSREGISSVSSRNRLDTGVDLPDISRRRNFEAEPEEVVRRKIENRPGRTVADTNKTVRCEIGLAARRSKGIA